MIFGTYSYGLDMRWRGCKVQNDMKPVSKTNCCNNSNSSMLGSIMLPGHHISVLYIRNGGCGGRGCFCYCIGVEGGPSERCSLTHKVTIRREIVERLYWRFIVTRQGHSHLTSHQDQPKVSVTMQSAHHESSAVQALPGQNDSLFLNELCNAVCRKYVDKLNPLSRTVSPDLYSLWVLTSRITVELFADSFNESGVLMKYCSLDKADRLFGSIGAWEDIEGIVEGAGGNPPYDTTFLQRMVSIFDGGARGSAPYCRCVLLPLGKKHGLIERTTSLSSKGIMLIRIPPGCLSFRHQETHFSCRARPKQHGFQELGIFKWRSREYLEKYSPPQDVELLYMNWIAIACRNPSRVSVDFQAFRKAFPLGMRNNSSLLETFTKR